MSTKSLLQKLGVFVIEDFLTNSECTSIRHEMLNSDRCQAATYSKKANQEKINDQIRKTDYCAISIESDRAITKRIKEIKPSLELFFNTKLADKFEHPKYLHYSKGDFFAPHTDDQLNRKINITINLNDKSPSSNEPTYDGGDLQLYGLIKQGDFASRGIAAPTTSGCLIAYPVNIVHEVTPISFGSRFSIVSRFLAE